MNLHHHAGAARGQSISSSSGEQVLGKSALNENGWEKSDFPILCETCLGPNPYIRMTKSPYDKECKVCARPFTVFRWRPGKEARYKKTEICQTCAKLKNVCQTCLFDLEYGLPVQIRDQELQNSVKIDIPVSDSNKEWFAEHAELKTSLNDLPYGKVPPTETVLKLARTAPYYQRNRSHICSFFVKGQCTRGSECPYRHEMPSTGELAHQDLKDRYYGQNDPVANKMLRQAKQINEVDPPEDETITSLYVGGVTPQITEEDIKNIFYCYGEIASIRMVIRSQCAFVNYILRKSAEKAMKKLSGKLIIKGTRLRLLWGRPQNMAPIVEPLIGGAGGVTDFATAQNFSYPSIVGQPMQPMQSMPPMPPMPSSLSSSSSQVGQTEQSSSSSSSTPAQANYFGLPQFPPPLPFPPPGAQFGANPTPIVYPSMNPSALGSRPQKKESQQ
eukprot:c21007_g1_i2.p2 GENE.c21007_g1_i2~~c21007_g1_i2.p2  ORF type:complete len:444 (-),score=214.67 c21007_g1_i2:17-1348(-)